MDKDIVKGAAKEAKGGVKRAVGKASGDKKMEARGAAEQMVGKAEKAIGKAKDAIRRDTHR